jgi:hypothetical protein
MPAGGRIDGIDFWRGFALLSIFSNHVTSNVIAHVTHRNFGFSDAAELFVFLSGASVTLAYGSYFLQDRLWSGIWAVLRRVFKIYWVHILISVIAILLYIPAGHLFDEDEFLDEGGREAVRETPLQAAVGLLALSHQLEMFNILPLYVVLLLGAPLAFFLARRNAALMLLASAALYAAVRLLNLNLPSWPEEGEWYFNPLAWQVLFVMGIFTGLRLKSGRNVPRSAPLFALCLVVVLLSAFAVTEGFGLVHGLRERFELLDLDKTDVGLVRLAHFVALAYATYYSGVTELLRRTVVFAPMCLIGRHSLAVFATGCVLAVIGQIIAEVYDPNEVLFMPFVIAGILVQYAVARWLSARAHTLKTAVAASAREPAAESSHRPPETDRASSRTDAAA